MVKAPPGDIESDTGLLPSQNATQRGDSFPNAPPMEREQSGGREERNCSFLIGSLSEADLSLHSRLLASFVGHHCSSFLIRIR